MAKTEIPIDIYVSDSVLLDGTFGVYGVCSDEPAVEIYLAGGFDSVDDATQKAASSISALRKQGGHIPDDHVVTYRPRKEFVLPESYSLLKKEDLAEAISRHVNEWSSALTKKAFLRGLLSYGNVLFYGTLVILWIYWTMQTITVPHLEFPVVGNRFAGKVLDRRLAATYYPIALFVLYAASFFRMLSVNFSYNELRLKLLALVKNHGWTLRELAKDFQISSQKSMHPLFLGLMRWVQTNDPYSLSGLLTLAEGSGGNGRKPASEAIALDHTELARTLGRWIRTDFDQRFHNLLYLDKSKTFSPAFMCFDPVVYLMMNNRTTFRLFSYLKEHGYEMPRGDAPTDPYLMERVTPFVLWLGVGFSVFLFGGTSVWSLVIEHSSLGWTILRAAVSTVALVAANWWNVAAVRGRRGFPAAEPIGAYTVGRYGVNRLSLVGW
jgi:hypothetical protein